MRSETVDSQLGPFENKATNPGFERITAGSVVMRRNLHRNPSLGVGAGGWGVHTPGGNVAAGSRIVGQFGPTGAYYRITMTVLASPSDTIFVASSAGGTSATGILPGRVYTMSIYGRVSWPANIRAKIEFYTSSGTWLNQADGPITAAQAGTVYRVSATAMAPATAAFARVSFVRPATGANPVVGDYLEASGVLIEERTEALPYFDGATVDRTGFSYSWEGTVHGSASTAQASSVEVYRNYHTLDPGVRAGTSSAGSWAASNNVAVFSAVAASWSASGTAARCTWTTRVNTSGNIGPAPHALNAARAAGTGRVTIVYSLRVSAASVVAPTYTTDNVTGWTLVDRAPLPALFQPNTTYTLFWTFDSTANFASNDQLRIYPQLPAVDGAWVELSMFDAYPGDYQPNRQWFDGNYSPDSDLTPSWTGAANTSPSIVSGIGVFGASASGTVRVAVRSWRWASQGASSLRIIPTGPDLDNLNGYVSFPIPFPQDTVFTAFVTIRLAAPLSPASSSPISGRTLEHRRMNGAVLLVSAKTPNEAGEYTVKIVSKTVGADDLIRFFHRGQLGSGDIWWDSLTLVEGVYDGPYFDGDMPGIIWTGTPHNSSSRGYPRLAPPPVTP